MPKPAPSLSSPFPQVSSLKETLATSAAELQLLRNKKDAAEAAASGAAARADALEGELRTSAKALAEAREDLRAERVEVERLAKHTAEQEGRAKEEAQAREALEQKVRVRGGVLGASTLCPLLLLVGGGVST